MEQTKQTGDTDLVVVELLGKQVALLENIKADLGWITIWIKIAFFGALGLGVLVLTIGTLAAIFGGSQ